MKYFLIAGEASGDLHASHLMQALLQADPNAEFQFYGGNCMQAVGGKLLCHYRHLAYMGFIQVAMHLPTILRGMRQCREAISQWKPDAVILVDYPGFNLHMARFVKEHNICPVYYYISPKIWAWKEHRIKQIRKYVDHLYSILPFEVDFFEKKHGYPITYVGNPTTDEIFTYKQTHGPAIHDSNTLALLPGSRSHEISDNLSRMLQAAAPLTNYNIVIAAAPSIPKSFYEQLITKSGIDSSRISLVEGRTYQLLSRATAALVTSGTATLETALFGVPQVVCYYMKCGKIVSFIRPYFLKVRFISLVNLIANREVVPELVADGMTVENIRTHLQNILPGAPKRQQMLNGYELVKQSLGGPGAPQRAATDIVTRLSARS